MKDVQTTPPAGDSRLSLRIADTFKKRLLGVHHVGVLRADEGLLFVPCGAIHTFFLWQRLDVVFLDVHGRERRCARNIGPWRIVRAVGAHMVIELQAGYCERHPDYLKRIHAALQLRVCPRLSKFQG